MRFSRPKWTINTYSEPSRFWQFVTLLIAGGCIYLIATGKPELAAASFIGIWILAILIGFIRNRRNKLG